MGKGREKEKVLLADRPHKVAWSWNSVMPYPYTVATGYKLSLCPQGKLLHIKKISSSFLSSILPFCCVAPRRNGSFVGLEKLVKMLWAIMGLTQVP